MMPQRFRSREIRCPRCRRAVAIVGPGSLSSRGLSVHFMVDHIEAVPWAIDFTPTDPAKNRYTAVAWCDDHGLVAVWHMQGDHGRWVSCRHQGRTCIARTGHAYGGPTIS